jgi:3-deoxy-manno-octulosonate cytidylyltransferase (CMP-KDO synthetase)
MFHVVIPARFNSTRLPGKALASIHDFPMLYWVWQRAMQAGALSVLVATDDERIEQAMRSFGAKVVMTRSDHPSGTDRLAEVAEIMGWCDDTIVVNLQGDEPLMPASNLSRVARLLHDNPEAAVATLATPITDSHDFRDEAAVKVVCDYRGRALYFSRASIPAERGVAPENPLNRALGFAQRHIGLYAYRGGFLNQFVQWSPAPLEQLEGLEQLRALYYGETIMVAEPVLPVPAGVDTPEDLARIRAIPRSHFDP